MKLKTAKKSTKAKSEILDSSKSIKKDKKLLASPSANEEAVEHKKKKVRPVSSPNHEVQENVNGAKAKKLKTAKKLKAKTEAGLAVSSPQKHPQQNGAKEKNPKTAKKNKTHEEAELDDDEDNELAVSSPANNPKQKNVNGTKTKNSKTSEQNKPQKETEASSDSEVDDDEDIKPEDKQEESEKVKRGKEYSIFVGNLPTTTKASEVKEMFKKYGTILNTRARAYDGNKIMYKKELKNLKAINYYVRFSAKEEMESACEMNGQMVGENRIRVTPENKKQFGEVCSTVFVGNIYRGTTDNELYEFFGQVGEIEYVRQISNKCIAYVCFKKGVSIKKALKLDQTKLHNRPLRVQKIDINRSNVKKNKKGNLVKRNKTPGSTLGKNGAAGKPTTGEEGDFHGKVAEKKKKKKSTNAGKGSEKFKKGLAEKLKAAMVGKKQ
ncbi:RNA-binding protein 34-like [Anopheles nili]|uniref:RNA-binding protein 34-like n=1 Tax=Anopheles nili TaxID=185578 RepID=UPI00237AFE63|nr:RNA-binding protein 34-like [Anopheles nili]